MKKLYSTITLLCFSAIAFAQQQIPNSGFETWTTKTSGTASYISPDPWNPGSFCASAGGPTVCEVTGTRSQDANTGNYSMLMNSEESLGMIVLFDYPLTGNPRPTTFNLYVKTNFFSGDKLSVVVQFHNGKISAGTDVTIGEGLLEVTENYSTYIKVSGNINFTSQDPYENVSVIVAFDTDDATTGSTATIDDFSFGYGPLSILDAKNNTLLSSTILHDNLIFNQEISQFELTDMTGKSILKGSNQVVNVQDLKNGLYVVRALKKDGEIVSYKVTKN